MYLPSDNKVLKLSSDFMFLLSGAEAEGETRANYFE